MAHQASAKAGRGGPTSRSGMADIGDEMPNVAEILERVGEEALA